ncbi:MULTISPECIES: GNAT family N-acetyltransferase [Streptomyces]|uniref:GNAT family N-acetyltransferase n=1 Tax=Streptomyces TaxID=1883 RepID=UPI00017E801A|nr:MULTISPECIES: GNAT family N-acetyltransferase [Streptomyces]AKL65357.1 acetyltransferase [Streptomyces sp. Mg1]EDX23500.1 acetyltransferase [Streptomyces sp. Mg1]WBY19338.1 GNAT family N-acetyltransferase [Streptomyces goshikiensis]WSY00841.1 GNAT family N-acetyltransferase [Streptomyces goshikiensis]
MTTTLRPSAPLQQSTDGARSRPYEVRVNSRRVGALLIASDTPFGPTVGEIRDLSIDEPDRRRGRATVAALAAEEVLRGWGCRRVRVRVPAGSAGGLRMAAALGYTEDGRNMAKELPAVPPALSEGVRGRPMTPAEFEAWEATAREEYAETWAGRGMSPQAARAKSAADHDTLLPRGLATPGVTLQVLEAAGAPVGHVWVSSQTDRAYVFDVEVRAGHRGRGYGRDLMLLAERAALAGGHRVLALHVFADNTPARRLYESLGYRPTDLNFAKDLI